MAVLELLQAALCSDDLILFGILLKQQKPQSRELTYDKV